MIESNLPGVSVVWRMLLLLLSVRPSRAFHFQSQCLYSRFIPRYDVMHSFASSSLQRSGTRFCSRMMSPDHHQTIKKTLVDGTHIAEMIVKKSRFIGYAMHVDSWTEAQNFIAAAKDEHPKARHWCYAFYGGIHPVNERSSDDGEPSGTAGVPILNAIHGEALSDTICVVVRYFGGIKLGAGGLIRAYGSSARLVLREAPAQVLIPKATLRVVVEPMYIGAVYDVVATVQGNMSDESYDANGVLSLSITCEIGNMNRLQEGLKDSTRGNVAFLPAVT